MVLCSQSPLRTQKSFEQYQETLRTLITKISVHVLKFQFIHKELKDGRFFCTAKAYIGKAAGKKHIGK